MITDWQFLLIHCQLFKLPAISNDGQEASYQEKIHAPHLLLSQLHLDIYVYRPSSEAASATCIVLKNLLGRVRDQWSGSWDEQHTTTTTCHFWVNKSAAYLDMDRHHIILGRWAVLPLLDIRHSSALFLYKQFELFFSRPRRRVSYIKVTHTYYFGPLLML